MNPLEMHETLQVVENAFHVQPDLDLMQVQVEAKEKMLDDDVNGDVLYEDAETDSSVSLVEMEVLAVYHVLLIIHRPIELMLAEVILLNSF